ncbi:hypothetical protein R1flu_021984 [Riccia fluitans]|uniref:Calponin-homology (CH) domain-containing protein n=1 Tax=Riccia fluitans TaxID=41844 RepID=A0ABD1ZSJ8_9MARC
MAEGTPTRRNKRNSLSRGEDGQELPLNKRMQSPVVITGPDGRTLTRNRGGESLAIWSGRSRFETARAKNQMSLKQGGEAAMDSSSKKPSCMRQPTFSTPQTEKVKSVHFQNPISTFATPGDCPLPVSRTPVGTVEYVATPLPSSKARPSMSARKMKIKAAAKLQALDDHETQASRLVQARLDFSMGRQERAYVAWLNHVLDKSAGGCGAFRLEEKVTENSSLEGGDFRLIDEVYLDEDRENTLSSRSESSLGKSPRSALKPLNGLASRNTGSPAKRQLKDTFCGSATPERSALARLESPATPHLSSKRLKMIAEHGFSYSRDLHMQDVCRLSDLARRLKLHFSQNEREEILTVITQLAKHIDEGRLRMKKGCEILLDVALRKKALYVLLNYNAYWLKIGLHLVIGHTSILKEKVSEDGQGCGHKEYLNEEYALLEVFLEKHFFTHTGLSKAYATNKAIDGLYRDGYAEALGRVILKRFFLLVLLLDKAKRQTSLKISEGIDGLDGGSPPLFRSDARIKSSRHILQEFLSDVMHGEGDVIGNLGNLGYHVYHHQVPLSDYDFAVVDLVEDLQDGVRLCRLVHLLAASDTFILEHIQVPSNGRKRQLHNCHIALESLAQAGVPLEDEEGCSICAEDIVGGNRDKVFPLLWNIMVHLQLPLLVSRPRLCQEIAKLQGTKGGYPLGLNIGTVELLLKWTQVVCMISGNLTIRNFKTSFADGQALCYIANLYVPLYLPQSDVQRPHSHMNIQIDSTPNLRGPFSPAYKNAVAHNFGLVQAVARKLGNVPEVLQLVDLLGDPAMSEKNIVIFVAFLCAKLLEIEPSSLQVQERKNLDLEATDSHRSPVDDAPAFCSYLSRCSLESESPVGFNRSYTVSWPKEELQRSNRSSPEICSDIVCDVVANSSAAGAEYEKRSLRLLGTVQAWWRGRRMRQQFLRKKRAVQIIQKAWRSFSERVRIQYVTKIQAHWRGYLLRQMFLRWKEAALIHKECQDREHAASVIQAFYRAWIQRRKYLETVSTMCKIQAHCWVNEARGNFWTQLKAVRTIESAWLDYLARKRLQYAPFVPLHWHQYTARQSLIRLSTASSLNQSWYRNQIEQCDDVEEYKMIDVQGWLQDSVLQSTDYYIAMIQASWRAHVARKKFLNQKRAASVIQSHWRSFVACKRRTACTRIQARWRSFKVYCSFIDMKLSAVIIQRFYRGSLVRRQRQRQSEAVVRLQAWYRGLVQRRRYQVVVRRIIAIQSSWRAFTDRRVFTELKRAVLNRRRAAAVIQSQYRACVLGRNIRRQFVKVRRAVLCIERCYIAFRDSRNFRNLNLKVCKIQRTWRSLCARREFLRTRKAAVVIQQFFRSRLLRKTAEYELKICKVQAFLRALLERRRFLKQKEAVILIQTHYRAFRQRKVESLKHIARIQAIWRGNELSSKFLLLERAALQIQATYRCYKARQQFMRLKRAASLIQASYRAFSQSRFTPIMEPTFCGTLRSICTIQASWRSIKVRRMLAAHKGAAQTIQNGWLGYLKRRDLKVKEAASMIQAAWRATLIRRNFVACRAASIKIQAHFRGFAHRIRFKLYTTVVVRCQAVIRGYLVRKRIRASHLRPSCLYPVHDEADRCVSTVYLHQGEDDRDHTGVNDAVQGCFSQAVAIGQRESLENVKNFSYLCEDLSTEHRQNVSSGEDVVPCSTSELCDSAVSSQYEYCEQVYAAMMIQACWKGYSFRKQIDLSQKEQQTACDENQTGSRVDGPSLHPNMLTTKERGAGLMILRWLVHWRQRSSFLKLRNAVLLLQSHVRGWSCRRKFIQTRKQTVFIQAHWRGVLLRKKTSAADQELEQLRQRIQYTAASVQDSDRLGNRLTEALAILLGQKTVTGILSICRTIDVATQHSRNCCDRLAEAGAVTKILNLIQTINRSPPHEEVLKHALAILNNLAHYTHLRILIAESPGAVSIISEILHMFRNKDEVFSLAMELFKPLCELSVCMELLQREHSIFRRLQLVVQFLDHKVQVEKRNFVKLPPKSGTVQRKAVEKKVTEASWQFSALLSILKAVTKLEHRKRRNTAPVSVPLPSVAKLTPLNQRRPSLATRPSNLGPRLPFQDRSNW